jgi:hypothetical protein
MRRLITLLSVLAVAATAYVASPFLAAWKLREAVKRGDVAAIEHRVQWEQVRSTLKESIARHADLLPIATQAGSEVKPTLWQRVKSVFGTTVLDRFVEAYVTPEGLPQLFQYRKTWKETIKGEVDEAHSLAWHERFRRFWARIKRAEFHSLAKVEIEMQDKQVADRSFISVFELAGTTWKLTSLSIVSSGADKVATIGNGLR